MTRNPGKDHEVDDTGLKETMNEPKGQFFNKNNAWWLGSRGKWNVVNWSRKTFFLSLHRGLHHL